MKKHYLPGIFFIFVVISVLSSGTNLNAQESECSSSRTRWEQALQDLKAKLQDFSTIQQSPVERISQRPDDASQGKTIAKQIADLLQIKEDILNSKRKECRNIMAQEEKEFSDLQSCIQSSRMKDKDVKNLIKKRQALIEKAAVALAEVKEVEGKETAMPYAETMQDPYSRSANYWQNYQQMYRRWWGQ